MKNLKEFSSSKGKCPIIAILLAIIFTVYFSIMIWKYPLIGIEVKEKDGEFFVSTIYESGWAAKMSIEAGDRVDYVDGIHPKFHSTVHYFNRIEMAKTITMIKDDSIPIVYSITYQDSQSRYGIFLLIPIIFSISNILLSSYLYYKKRDDSAAITLLYFLLSLGTCYVSAYGSVRGNMVGMITISFLLPGSLMLFVKFLQNYFTKYRLVLLSKNSMKFLYIVYFLSVSFSLVNIFNSDKKVTGIIELGFYIFFVCIIGVLLSYFFYKNKKSDGSSSIKILLLTNVLALIPFVGFSALPRILLNKEWVSAEITASFLIIIPIAFVYLQLTEKLFDIDYLISRFRYYSLLTLPFAIFITMVMNFLMNTYPLSSYNIGPFSLVFISTIVFLYLKEFIDYKNKGHLFSQKNSYEDSLYKFFQKAKYETKVNSLISKLQTEIRRVLKVTDTVNFEIVFAKDQKKWTLKKVDVKSITLAKDLEKVNWEIHHLGSLLKIKKGYCIVIGENYNSRNVIFCGLKQNKTNLNLQERIWLETIAYYSGILLENFKLIEGLFLEIEHYKEISETNPNSYPYWLSRLLFSISEKERTNLSIDLHDSVLQDQLQLLRDVEFVKDRLKDPQAVYELNMIMERMLDNIHLIRETCNELRPPFLCELGIIQSITNLVEQTRLRAGFILHSELDQNIRRLGNDIELTIYRVVQELLNNAMKHSNATEVKITLIKIKSTIRLVYEDNGIGMDMTEMQDSFHTMGIAGIKERVKSLGGQVEIISKPGQGLKVVTELRSGGEKHDD